MAQLPPDSQAATASQFTPLSAFAVPVATNIEAIGARARAPAMVASPNVVRMFFTSFLSPSARRQRPLAQAQMPMRQRGLGHAISVRHDRGSERITPPDFTP